MTYTIDDKDMTEWKRICRAFCKKHDLTLLFVNNTSLGAENKKGELMHIYIDELMEMI